MALVAPVQLRQATQAAESAYHLPANILLGIWAIESGRTYPNPAVNSSGYGGLFGLHQGQNGIDLLNPNTTTQQAMAAGAILSNLISVNGGNLNSALLAYSGGGYGLSTIQGIIGQVSSAVSSAVSAAVQAIKQFFSIGQITQPFGCTTLAMEPAPPAGVSCSSGHYHYGVDYAVPTGTPIPSLTGGTVVQSGWNPAGFGNSVTVQYASGATVLYGHMQSVGVAAGQAVNAGQTLGLSDSTGNSTGPHVHIQQMVNGAAVDPTALIQQAMGGASPGGSGNVTASSPSTATAGLSIPGVTGLTDALGAIALLLKDVTTTMGSIFSDLGRLGSWLAVGAHWWELGFIVLGFVLIGGGGTTLLFGNPTVQKTAVKAAKVAAA